MIKLGQYNELRIERRTDNGLYLEDEDRNEVLLPNAYIPPNFEWDDIIKVFIYRDGEERIVATTKKPKIELNDFAILKVNGNSKFGAFMDWGLPKDLFVPFGEQMQAIKLGEEHLIYLFLDEKSDRLVGSSKISKYLEKDNIELTSGEEVDLIVWKISDIGIKVIINKKYQGLLYHDSVYKPLVPGQKVKGYIKEVREDKKIDVVLENIGYSKVEPNAQKILEILQNSGNFLDLNDKSDPEMISARLRMSKKTFKKAIGALYKQRIIRIEKDGIYLV